MGERDKDGEGEPEKMKKRMIEKVITNNEEQSLRLIANHDSRLTEVQIP